MVVVSLKKIFENTLLREFARQAKLNCYKRLWRKRNPENETIMADYFPWETVLVGKRTYGELNVITFNHKSRLIIGSYCSIAPKVTFLLDVEHRTNTSSTYPFRAKCLKMGDEAFSKGDIIIEDDVWIGYGAMILSGVHIGRGAIIAAGAIVTRDVPPYAIVGGVPAKIIRYRVKPNLIKELLEIDYDSLTDQMIGSHVDELYTELTDSEQLEWLPKRKL